MRDTSQDLEGLLDRLADRVAERVIQRLDMQPSGQRFEDEPQDGPDTAEWLKISPQTLERLRKNGTVPFIQAGRRISYLPSAVLNSLHESQEGGAA